MGPVCFGEIGLRSMGPYDGPLHRDWHRDRAHWHDHPLRMDYLQLVVYFRDVNAGTHCLSLSPSPLPIRCWTTSGAARPGRRP